MAEGPTLLLEAKRQEGGEWHVHLQLPDSRTTWIVVEGLAYRVTNVAELAAAIGAKLGPAAQLTAEP